MTLELLHDDRACATQAPVLLVMLPGAHMTPAEMKAEGLVQALRQRRLAVDVVLAGAGLEYVYDRSVLRRLHEDVILPYTAAGYRRIWLMGISLGGFVAMGYAQAHPGTVAGIVALAPYLGRRQTVAAVQAAGGAAAWAAATPPQPADIDDRLWRWLAAPPAGAPPLHLGYGTEDRFAPAHRTLAAGLPAAQVITRPGGHDWAPWRQLWADWLDRGLFPRTCG